MVSGVRFESHYHVPHTLEEHLAAGHPQRVERFESFVGPNDIHATLTLASPEQAGGTT